MDSKRFSIYLYSLALFAASMFCQQIHPNHQNHQNQQQQQIVVQPTSDVNPDRSAFNQPITYDYTYLTKPYGYSAFRAYDQGQMAGYGTPANNIQGGNYNGGYGASNYGSYSSLFQAAWPLILLPFLIFFGLTVFLPLIVHIPNQWGSRQSSNDPTDEASFIIQSVIQAVESNKCLRKTSCDMGLYARHLGTTKSTVLEYVEKFSPATLAPYIDILKEAANHKGEVKDYCEQFTCDQDLLIKKSAQVKPED